MEGHEVAPPVFIQAYQTTGDLLADEKSTIDVISHAVGLEGRLGCQLHAGPGCPPPTLVTGDVAEIQCLLTPVPHWSLGCLISLAELDEFGIGVDQRLETGSSKRMKLIVIPPIIAPGIRRPSPASRRRPDSNAGSPATAPRLQSPMVRPSADRQALAMMASGNGSTTVPILLPRVVVIAPGATALTRIPVVASSARPCA